MILMNNYSYITRRRCAALSTSRRITFPYCVASNSGCYRNSGYALTLDHDVASGNPIDANKDYCYEIERGPVKLDGNRL